MEQHRSGYIVSEGRGDGFRIESLPEWQRPVTGPEARPAVGDWLLISGNAGGKPSAVALLPRHSAIKRAVAGEQYAQQVIAANIDTVFIVCGLDGDFNPRRIERYLLLVHGGAQPVVVLTKADTDSSRDGPTATAARALATELATRDLPVVAINARRPESAAVLAPWLAAGRTAVLVGSSGAGKSTLTNTLVGHERMQTGTVRQKDARGRHTTTHRALIALPSGACLIDTPGMRERKPAGEEDLAETRYADLDALARRCRFRDCRHRQDPGCAPALQPRRPRARSTPRVWRIISSCTARSPARPTGACTAPATNPATNPGASRRHDDPTPAADGADRGPGRAKPAIRPPHGAAPIAQSPTAA